jgi:hypothetical protein
MDRQPVDIETARNTMTYAQTMMDTLTKAYHIAEVNGNANSKLYNVAIVRPMNVFKEARTEYHNAVDARAAVKTHDDLRPP